MKLALRMLLGLCLVTVLTAVAEAKEWRGLKPLRSNREDVARVLGASPDANDIRAKYNLKDEEVYIVFATRESYVEDCVKQLPLGTVMQIQVTPKTEVQLADLGLDEGRLEKFDPSDPKGVGYAAFYDKEQGLVVRTHKGRVDQIVYTAAAADRHLCQTYYEDPRLFVGLIVEAGAADVSIDCPEGTPRAGERITFSVMVAGASPDLEPTFKWEVSAGRIVGGQGTYSITVDTRGLAGRRVKASVEVGGVGSAVEESCEVEIARVRRRARRRG